ncbi:MAG TPA: hypothetical protein P5305_04055 [Rubrivivax sp.]|nr:hypothetical protein [Rubrivivax sp.]HRY87036.1 hypothetical protein [Rubrivivax sp.]
MATPQEQVQLTAAITELRGLASDMAEVKSSMTRLADAVTRLAVMEERQITDRATLGRAFSDLEKLEARVKALEQAHPLQKQSSEWVIKGVGLILAAVLGAGMSGVLRPDKAPQAQIGKP